MIQTGQRIRLLSKTNSFYPFKTKSTAVGPDEPEKLLKTPRPDKNRRRGRRQVSLRRSGRFFCTVTIRGTRVRVRVGVVAWYPVSAARGQNIVSPVKRAPDTRRKPPRLSREYSRVAQLERPATTRPRLFVRAPGRDIINENRVRTHSTASQPPDGLSLATVFTRAA